LRPALPRFDVPVSETLWTLHLPPGRVYRVQDEEFSVVEETSALRPKQRAPSVLGSLDMASRSSDYVSQETVAEQRKQASRIQQQLKTRQGASRKGAMPVRIALPGGISSMPRVTVARILMVDQDATDLDLRCYPGWLRSLARHLQTALIVVAGVLFGLLFAGTFPWLRLWMAGAVLLLAMVPGRGLGPGMVCFLAGLIAFASWFVIAFMTRRRQRTMIDRAVDRTDS
jgi:hypothetical protein